MILDGKSYVPTLAVRASEMNGLEFLPSATKDNMLPCFLLAPWANSSTLEKAIGRIEAAYPQRSYFLDIDRDYQFTNLESLPQQELAELINPARSFGNWVEFVRAHENVIPCLQTRDQSSAELRTQIQNFQDMGRSYCVRIVRDRFPNNVGEILSAITATGTADYAIILEGGWTTDPLSLAVWFNGIVMETLQSIDADIPIILSCTSMPKVFTNFDGGISAVAFSNRQLVDQISQQSNRARLVYGDWGSTRPRESSGFANRPINRIDYPTANAWNIARNKKDEWDFRDAAIHIVNSDAWNGELGIWGEEMIQQSTINEQLGIDTPQKNVASRVNIHLHLQAFYDQPGLNSMDFDEDWID